jgi:hypothetical protein
MSSQKEKLRKPSRKYDLKTVLGMMGAVHRERNSMPTI